MKYFTSKTVDLSYDKAIEKVTDLLKEEGFGVLTEIDVKETLKKKLDVDFKKYKIPGACNVIVEEHENGKVEVSAVNPVASMQAVSNEGLQPIADEVRKRLEKVISNL